MATTKASAEALSVFLNGHGLACLALHSGVKPIERLRYLDDLKSGRRATPPSAAAPRRAGCSPIRMQAAAPSVVQAAAPSVCWLQPHVIQAAAPSVTGWTCWSAATCCARASTYRR